MYYLYGMPLLVVEPRVLGITTCSLVTILIMLTFISNFVDRVS
jgi:hypothetical protein